MTHMNLRKMVLSLTVLAGFSATAGELPRGADVDELASNCNIGAFPQVSKAGGYNALCNVMQDSEKCLALFKRGFRYNGQEVVVRPLTDERAQYCLEVLTRDLGLGD